MTESEKTEGTNEDLSNIRKIINDVRKGGDAAVREYTKIFDKAVLDDFSVSQSEIKNAYQQINPKTLLAIKKAGANIRQFAKLQMRQFKNFEYAKNGVILGQKINPIETIGVYVPGGNYPLPSSALMAIIPAKVAGVKKVIVCSPKIQPVTIVAANWAGANLIFKIGGVQAIAAMAYGTKTVPKVDKIVGPGNIYVTLAKKEIYGDCGIDFLAGPSEILIIADDSANPKFLAADLLAQAEHDSLARGILVSNSASIIAQTKNEVIRQSDVLNMSDLAKKIVKDENFIKVANTKSAIQLANEIAPEHLFLSVAKPKQYLNQLKNYGSLFLGEYSAVAFGDYCSGTNHILPTQQNAKFTGGLSVKDFLKIQTYQAISKKGADYLGKTAITLANVENLKAHENSIRVRRK